MPWHYVHDNQPRGPVSDEQLAGLLSSGQLTPDSLIWREGMGEWQPAKTAFSPAPRSTPDIETLNTPIGGPAESIADWAGLNANPRNEPLKFAFTGNWRSYYRVWFVGLVLTILSLGLYAPWAKIRNKRYLYAHTRLGDDGFGYHANPWSMLAGNLVVAGLFACWLASPLIHPALPFGLIAAGLVILPWILTKSVRFNARATSWRGLRFDFDGSTFGFIWSHVLLPVLSLGVLWPVATRARRRWLIGNLRYGDTPFRFDASLAELYGIYLKGLIFFIPAGLCYLGLAINAYVDAESARTGGLVFLPLWAANIARVGPEILPYMLPVALGGIDYIKARLFTCFWNGTTLGDHACQCYMAPWDVFKLRMLHGGMLLLSLGLLWPWVKIHGHVFKLERIDLATTSDLGEIKAPARTAGRDGALGESAADLLDFEIGL